MNIITENKQETVAIAKNFAKTLKGGEVIGLIGPLGAGKTVFTKAMGKYLGVEKTINSPTFVLMNVYQTKANKFIKRLVHIDAYRLNNKEELFNIGAFEFFYKKDTIVIIEWIDKITDLINDKKIIIININNNSN